MHGIVHRIDNDQKTIDDERNVSLVDVFDLFDYSFSDFVVGVVVRASSVLGFGFGCCDVLADRHLKHRRRNNIMENSSTAEYWNGDQWQWN